MDTKLERIAKRVAAANELDILQSVIEGASYNKNEAIKSVQDIIKHSGNSQAKTLLDEFFNGPETTASVTAGAGDWIKRIQQAAKGNKKILMALLAAAALAGAVPASAAEKALNENGGLYNIDTKKIEQVAQHFNGQPLKEMSDYIYKYAGDWIKSPDKGGKEFNDVDQMHNSMRSRMKMLYQTIILMEKASSKNPDITLEQAFNNAKNTITGTFRNPKDFRIIQEAYDSYCKECSAKQVNVSTTPCHIPQA